MRSGKVLYLYSAVKVFETAREASGGCFGVPLYVAVLAQILAFITLVACAMLTRSQTEGSSLIEDDQPSGGIEAEAIVLAPETKARITRFVQEVAHRVRPAKHGIPPAENCSPMVRTKTAGCSALLGSRASLDCLAHLTFLHGSPLVAVR